MRTAVYLGVSTTKDQTTDNNSASAAPSPSAWAQYGGIDTYKQTAVALQRHVSLMVWL
jgi:hypothetical protein